MPAKSAIALLILFSVVRTETALAADYSTIRYEDEPAEACTPKSEATTCLVSREDLGLAVGGQIRQRFEYQRNPDFAAATSEDSVWLHRYGAFGELRLGMRGRVFVELHSALEQGRTGGPSPVDENRLSLQNAFVELRSRPQRKHRILFRLGRQELQFGSGRLVSVREGPNVRRTFDGGLLETGWIGRKVRGFFVRPRDDAPGILDDDSDTNKKLWGVYAAALRAPPSSGKLDLYYLGYTNRTAVFDQGSGWERRHSLGARWFGSGNAWDWSIEPIVQVGSFGGARLLAWTIASQTGWTWSKVRSQPRLGLSTNYASGDRDAADNRLQTFNPLFPRGNYFSQAAILGPYNFFNVNPQASIKPHPDVFVSADVNFFWRASLADGAYSPSGRLLASATSSRARAVTEAVSLQIEWAAAANLDLSAVYTRFDPGPFLYEGGLDRDIDFVELTAKVQF